MRLTILLTFILVSFTSQEETLENAVSSEYDPEDYGPYIRPPISSAPADNHTSDQANLWRQSAIHTLWRERKNMSHTPIITLKLNGAKIVLKNESASRSESLKHRFAWALFMWAVLQGHVQQNTTVYEASSGNTAASEAYMCGLINVKFITFVPKATDEAKVRRIKRFGGRVYKVENGTIEEAAEKAAKNDTNGFYMNQFGNADVAEEHHFTNREGKRRGSIAGSRFL
ncbi:pyridoxal-phosphate dependent enzyme domain-containing protein [Ditylenchus destructor]|uniref:Pyridoxal-phosphate dependent enzyme domain-containing protein n=1 Tax=Ditylenchus destructor TaxID=166010 RepID=A0AAD4MMQ5_9BILA|nr:pyridoxal-phosphate dependent enzyme domain-containing protein [Ditylenchus destructor]